MRINMDIYECGEKLKALRIGDMVAKIPIIQGGMGVGISRSKLAGAVAAEGAFKKMKKDAYLADV